MKLFLTGGTGYTGSIALRHFAAAGHQIVALARRPPAGEADPRVTWVQGDFEDGAKIADLVRQADAAIHIGASHDPQMERLDRIVIEAIAEALAGSGRAFINTSAAPLYGDTGTEPRDEHEPIENPLPARAWRMRHDQWCVALTSRGVRSVVLRPPLIYGGAGGPLSDNIKRARATGKALYIGDGTHRSSTVHVDALSALYLLALQNEAAQGVYNAASDDVVKAVDIAEVIAACHGPGIVAEVWPLREARKVLGEFADIAAVTCVVSSERARTELGWKPSGPGVLSELISGSYRRGPLLDYHGR